jgi:DNA-directed RNA polymerase specialized sigma24 family protein
MPVRLTHVNDGQRALTGSRTMWARRAVRQTNASRSVPRATSTAERADAFRHVAGGRLHDAYKLASAILGSPTEARDAVHDAFVIAWQRWPKLRDRDRFDPWFRQIIVNVCRDRLRRSSKQRAVEAEAQSSQVVSDASHQVHNRLMVEEGLRQAPRSRGHQHTHGG